MIDCKVNKSGERKQNKENEIWTEILLSSDKPHGLRRPQHEDVLKGKFKTLGVDPQARGLMTADAYEEQWSNLPSPF